jgi:hypothetical protein
MLSCSAENPGVASSDQIIRSAAQLDSPRLQRNFPSQAQLDFDKQTQRDVLAIAYSLKGDIMHV